MRGIRGAVTVENNSREEIIEAVQSMLRQMMHDNGITTADIGAALFSATDDITAVFPAFAARLLPGWDLVPLFDAQQLYIDGSIRKCVRVLLLVDTDKSQADIHHVYLGRAAALRPDISADK